MSKKLIIAFSAALISAKLAGATAYSETTLDNLERLLESNDLTAIQLYLTQNDTLLAGDDPLAGVARLIIGETFFGAGEFNYDVAANNGKGKGRGYVPWSERPGKGRKSPPPKHPHIY